MVKECECEWFYNSWKRDTEMMMKHTNNDNDNNDNDNDHDKGAYQAADVIIFFQSSLDDKCDESHLETVTTAPTPQDFKTFEHIALK